MNDNGFQLEIKIFKIFKSWFNFWIIGVDPI